MKDNNVFMKWILFSAIISIQIFVILFNTIPRYELKVVQKTHSMTGTSYPVTLKFNNHDGTSIGL